MSISSASEPPSTRTFWNSRVNRAHLAKTVVFNRLTDFRLRIHHEWPVARDWFVQRHSGYQQHFERIFRVQWICDSHFVAVLCKQNHLPISSALVLRSEQTLTLYNVSEGVVST